MPDIARLDEDGLLVAVETVADEEHGTDLAKRKIALPDGHDMRRHLKNYRWDVLRGHFISKSMEPLAEAERETPELVEGLVEAIEDLYDKLGEEGAGRRPVVDSLQRAHRAGSDLVMPERTRRAFDKFRRVVPRRKPQTIEISSDRVAAAEASLRDNPPAVPNGVGASSATNSEKTPVVNRQGPRAHDPGKRSRQHRQSAGGALPPARQYQHPGVGDAALRRHRAVAAATRTCSGSPAATATSRCATRPTPPGRRRHHRTADEVDQRRHPVDGVEDRRHQGDDPRRRGGLGALERRHDRRSVFRRHQPRQSRLLGAVRQYPVGRRAGCTLYVAGTWTPVGRAGDWRRRLERAPTLANARVLGRAMASQGLGAGLRLERHLRSLVAASDGEESVQLVEAHICRGTTTRCRGTITLSAQRAAELRRRQEHRRRGPYTLADTSSGVTWTESYPGRRRHGWAGGNHGAQQRRPALLRQFPDEALGDRDDAIDRFRRRARGRRPAGSRRPQSHRPGAGDRARGRRAPRRNLPFDALARRHDEVPLPPRRRSTAPGRSSRTTAPPTDPDDRRRYRRRLHPRLRLDQRHRRPGVLVHQSGGRRGDVGRGRGRRRRRDLGVRPHRRGGGGGRRLYRRPDRRRRRQGA